MPPTFTTTSISVNIAPNVVFDFGAKTIGVPAGITAIDAQWLIDHVRLAEESVVGLARPSIATGSGKVTIDLDASGNPIRTGVVAILNGWKITTLRTTGSFAIKDIYSDDNSIPYILPSPVPVRYQQTIGGVLMQGSGEGGGLGLQPTLNAILSDIAALPAAIDQTLADNFAAISAAIASGGISDELETKILELWTDVRLIKKIRGLADGVSVSAKRPSDTPGYLRSSDGEIDLPITRSGDIETIG